VVASAAIPFRFDIALAPAIESKFSIDVSRYKTIADRSFMDLRDPLRVAMRVKDVYVGNDESVLGQRADDGKDASRSRVVVRLLDAIFTAKLNLSKYRIAFS